MRKLPYIVAAAAFSLSAVSVNAAESKVLSEAGLSLPSIETLVSEAPKVQLWTALKKITVNEAQPDMENTIIGMVEHGFNIDKAVKELKEAGFKAEPFQDNSGGYMVMVDVTGQDAADRAVGLSRYYYVTEVKVSRKVHNLLFGLNNRSTYAVKMGTIKGGINFSPVDIKLNKLDWTITGGMNHSPVDTKPRPSPAAPTSPRSNFSSTGAPRKSRFTAAPTSPRSNTPSTGRRACWKATPTIPRLKSNS